MSQLMIIDDERDVREYLKNYFTRRRIEVLTAENGEQALDLVDRCSPDLILMDVRMPGIDGVETLRRLRAKSVKSAVILVTGIQDQETLGSISDLAVSAVIHKPLVLEELEREVLARLIPVSR